MAETETEPTETLYVCGTCGDEFKSTATLEEEPFHQYRMADGEILQECGGIGSVYQGNILFEYDGFEYKADILEGGRPEGDGMAANAVAFTGPEGESLYLLAPVRTFPDEPEPESLEGDALRNAVVKGLKRFGIEAYNESPAGAISIHLTPTVSYWTGGAGGWDYGDFNTLHDGMWQPSTDEENASYDNDLPNGLKEDETNPQHIVSVLATYVIAWRLQRKA